MSASRRTVLSSCLGCSSFRTQQAIARSGRSSSESLLGDVIPYPEPGSEFGAVIGGSHTVPGRSEVRRYPAERGKESLCCTYGAEAFHRAFPLSGRLVGVLASIVQVFVLPVLRCRHHLLVRNLVTAKFIGDQDPRVGALAAAEGSGRTWSRCCQVVEIA